ncbi:TIGD6 [Cordylochernes scorpioides]|uniref:TIGD6 n=1 Tax=Cordylochernes scorpioides TaxID=51811 RepID=A0ABY6K7L3_9ARAC|nr:TIGD6 [Cordylochernes scorpioides]
MEQGREEVSKEPMESNPDYESGENTTFPKMENTLGLKKQSFAYRTIDNEEEERNILGKAKTKQKDQVFFLFHYPPPKKLEYLACYSRVIIGTLLSRVADSGISILEGTVLLDESTVLVSYCGVIRGNEQRVFLEKHQLRGRWKKIIRWSIPLIPDRTLAHKDENCRGVKRMKQRITVLLCCNSTGTDKRRLLIIGKSAKPRCFRNFSPHFYCTYISNSKAWMTSGIFQEWLQQFNKQLVSEGRRILLLLDNATSHSVPNDGLSNIKIHFLPPNMTASLQPLDSGIIKSFKAQYSKLQLQKMVELADAHLPTELRLD